VITQRHILRSALLRALSHYALMDSSELLCRLQSEGRITEVHKFGVAESDFYNVCIEPAEWQEDGMPSQSVRLSVSISNGSVIESGTLLVSDGISWAEDRLFSLGKIG